jgi:hypothetical protein
LSSITAQALYYLQAGSLAHKVLKVCEQDGASRASYALKLLVSEGRISIASAGKEKSTGRIATTSYETAGPVALLLTTTATEIDPELENRLVVLGADEGPDQTAAVIAAQRNAAGIAGLTQRVELAEIRRRHHSAQRLLVPYPVVIPEAEYRFPSASARHRRDHQKALSIVASLALLHQHQREQKMVTVAGREISYLEATRADLEQGLALARELLGRESDAVSPQARRLLALVRQDARDELAQGKSLSDTRLTRRELRERLGWSARQVRRATERLVDLEYLCVYGGGRGRLQTYCLTEQFAAVDLDEDRVEDPEDNLAPVGPSEGTNLPVPSTRENGQVGPLAPLSGRQCLGETVVVVSDEKATA